MTECIIRKLVATLNFMQRRFFYYCRAHYVECRSNIFEGCDISSYLLGDYCNLLTVELPFQLLLSKNLHCRIQFTLVIKRNSS